MTRLAGPLLLAAGAALLAVAVATGGARFYLLVVVPVFTGTTATFALAVVLLAAGFLLLPLSFSGVEDRSAPAVASPPSARPTDPSDVGSGGLILLGPFPIFFGRWRQTPPIPYRWAVVLGVVLAVAAVLLLWGFSIL